MAIHVSCSCGHQMQVKDAFAGRQIHCRDCGNVIKVPTERRARPRRPAARRDSYEDDD